MTWGDRQLEVLSVKQPLKLRGDSDSEILATFKDGQPAAVTSRVGRGTVFTLGFLPALSYIKPALIARRPLEQKVDADRVAAEKLSAAAALEDLLENGIEEIKQNIVDEIVKSVGCASAIEGIRRTKSGFRFPHDECSKHERCRVGDFLNESPDREPLLQFLVDNDERLTPKLKKGKESLPSLRKLGCVNARQLDPCMSIGDVLISLESRSAGVFLTQNFKESNLLCEQSEQTINVCPTNQDKLP